MNKELAKKLYLCLRSITIQNFTLHILPLNGKLKMDFMQTLLYIHLPLKKRFHQILPISFKNYYNVSGL
jgi:hypothetical protein